MTPFDDNDLIHRLQSGIAERQSGVSAPAGIADTARRAARRRTATRAVGAGVPVLAAAGVAAVLAIGSSPGSTAAGGPGAGGSALSAPTGAVKIEETAYIVRRVKAKVAADSQNGMASHYYSYSSGSESPDGSLVNLGPRDRDGAWQYIAPDGTRSTRSTYHNNDGSVRLITNALLVPGVNGKGTYTGTIINATSHTYSQTQFKGVPTSDTPAPNLQSSSSEVQQALQSGQVTQMGTTTVNGTHAIALSIKAPSVPRATPYDLTLYVDAQTYQPLRTVVHYSWPGLFITDWVPATPDNISQAKDDSIPAGYIKVKNALS